MIVGWEMSIRRCYQVLEPYIREMQRPENAGPQYWAGFDWLYRQIDLTTPKGQIQKSSLSFQTGTAHH
jgi:hypothetical protein